MSMENHSLYNKRTHAVACVGDHAGLVKCVDIISVNHSFRVVECTYVRLCVCVCVCE